MERMIIVGRLKLLKQRLRQCAKKRKKNLMIVILYPPLRAVYSVLDSHVKTIS